MKLIKEESDKLYNVVDYGRDFCVIEDLLEFVVGWDDDIETFTELKEKVRPIYEQILDSGQYYDYPLECKAVYLKYPIFYLNIMIDRCPNYFRRKGITADLILLEAVNIVLLDVVQKIMAEYKSNNEY